MDGQSTETLPPSLLLFCSAVLRALEQFSDLSDGLIIICLGFDIVMSANKDPDTKMVHLDEHKICNHRDVIERGDIKQGPRLTFYLLDFVQFVLDVQMEETCLQQRTVRSHKCLFSKRKCSDLLKRNRCCHGNSGLFPLQVMWCWLVCRLMAFRFLWGTSRA